MNYIPSRANIDFVCKLLVLYNHLLVDTQLELLYRGSSLRFHYRTP
jgi:hypothetical protein